MSIDTIRLSERAKTQLITLKRRTGIEHWNVFCRWAFCLSLREKSVPPDEHITTDSNVEMTWKTFAGPHAELYMALLRMRTARDRGEISDQTLKTQLHLHIHRGIAYLLQKDNLREFFAECH